MRRIEARVGVATLALGQIRHFVWRAEHADATKRSCQRKSRRAAARRLIFWQKRRSLGLVALSGRFFRNLGFGRRFLGNRSGLRVRIEGLREAGFLTLEHRRHDVDALSLELGLF